MNNGSKEPLVGPAEPSFTGGSLSSPSAFEFVKKIFLDCMIQIYCEM